MIGPNVEALLKQLRELIDGEVAKFFVGREATDSEKRKYRLGLIVGAGLGAFISKNTDLACAAVLLMCEEPKP